MLSRFDDSQKTCKHLRAERGIRILSVEYDPRSVDTGNQFQLPRNQIEIFVKYAEHTL